MARYAPGQVPNTPDIFQLERFLGPELEQVRGSTDDIYPLYELLRTVPMGAALRGDVDNFTLNGAGSVLENWTDTTIWFDQYSLMTIDPVTGTITVGRDGLYTISAHVVGDQGNSNKEESARLWVRKNGTDDVLVWVRDIATDKTDERCFNGTFVIAALAGDSFQLYMNASTNLGTFNTTTANFELVSRFISDPDWIVQPEASGRRRAPEAVQMMTAPAVFPEL